MPLAPSHLSVADRMEWLEREIEGKEGEIDDLQFEIDDLYSELVKLEQSQHAGNLSVTVGWCGACGLSFHLVDRSGPDPVTCEDCHEKDLLGIGREVCKEQPQQVIPLAAMSGS